MADLITSKQMKNGKTAVTAAFCEIKSIPSYSILSKQYSSENAAINGFKQEWYELLANVHQISQSVIAGQQTQIAVEILWVSESVENQVAQGKVRLFLVLRTLGPGDGKGTIHSLIELLEISLNKMMYEYNWIPADQMMEVLEHVHAASSQALVKDQTAEILKNNNVLYSFDKIPEIDSNLDQIVNTLIRYPGSAVSIQMIAASMDAVEQNALIYLNQAIDQMGLSGNRTTDIYKYYDAHKKDFLFQYNIVVYGLERDVRTIISALTGTLNSAREEHIKMQALTLGNQQANLAGNFYPLPWAVNASLKAIIRRLPAYANNIYSNLSRMLLVITAEEAKSLFRMPIGTETVQAGIKVNYTSITPKDFRAGLIDSGQISIGVLKSSGGKNTIGIKLDDLTKHMLIVGTPGSGKTTFSVSVLDRLWKDHRIPFLVIEPAKNEYRALIQSIPELQVFTPGKNHISPYVVNPFVPPKNVKLGSYKSTLKTAFAAAVPMFSPLDKIFEESISNCYSNFRWLDTYTSDNKGTIFNISDFIQCFQKDFAEIGYTGDAQNMGRGGVIRLKSLLSLFDNYYSIPIEDLLTKPTVIELAAIENSDEKALLIALLLLSILAYVNANYIGEGHLKNVILLEEAHVLMDADPNGAKSGADPSGIAKGLLKRMLAEARSYGLGLMIADQSPRKVGTDIVALTDMKIAFRQVEASDKQIIADSMNMDEVQNRQLSRLKPGEAFLFFNKLDEPEEVVTPDYRLENKISITLSDEGIRELSGYWKNHPADLRPYPECQAVRFCQNSCDYNRRVLAKEIARRIFIKNFSEKVSVKNAENGRVYNSKITNDEKACFAKLSEVSKNLRKLIIGELNDEQYSAELYACVKCQLLRKVRYETVLDLTPSMIQQLLSKL